MDGIGIGHSQLDTDNIYDTLPIQILAVFHPNVSIRCGTSVVADAGSLRWMGRPLNPLPNHFVSQHLRMLVFHQLYSRLVSISRHVQIHVLRFSCRVDTKKKQRKREMLYLFCYRPGKSFIKYENDSTNGIQQIDKMSTNACYTCFTADGLVCVDIPFISYTLKSSGTFNFLSRFGFCQHYWDGRNKKRSRKKELVSENFSFCA